MSFICVVTQPIEVGDPINGHSKVVNQYMATASCLQVAIKAVMDHLNVIVNDDVKFIRERDNLTVDEWNDGDYFVSERLSGDQKTITYYLRRRTQEGGSLVIHTLNIETTTIESIA